MYFSRLWQLNSSLWTLEGPVVADWSCGILSQSETIFPCTMVQWCIFHSRPGHRTHYGVTASYNGSLVKATWLRECVGWNRQPEDMHRRNLPQPFAHSSWGWTQGQTPFKLRSQNSHSNRQSSQLVFSSWEPPWASMRGEVVFNMVWTYNKWVKMGGDGVGLISRSLRLCLFLLVFFVSFLVYTFVHYKHPPNPEKAVKTDYSLIGFWMLEDICKFCFLQRIVGKYTRHPALFVFWLIKYPISV